MSDKMELGNAYMERDIVAMREQNTIMFNALLQIEQASFLTDKRQIARHALTEVYIVASKEGWASAARTTAGRMYKP